jgi:Rrf2 family protein
LRDDAMKLGTRARYGVRLMLAISGAGGCERAVNLADVSRRTGISRGYLEQLVIPLQRAGLLDGRAGRRGGQVLARPASQIALREVVEGSGESLAMVPCVDAPKCCTRARRCESRVVWTLLTLRLRNVLDDYTLADLADTAALRREVGAERRRLALRKGARHGQRRRRGG